MINASAIAAAEEFIGALPRAAEIFALLDGGLRCVCSNSELLPAGTPVLPRAAEDIRLPVTESADYGVFIRGERYCAEIIPFGTQGLYFCVLTNYRQAMETFAETDGADLVRPLFGGLEESMERAFRLAGELTETAAAGGEAVRLFELQRIITNMYAASCNVLHYFSMRDNGERAAVDAVRLVDSLVARCNGFLAKSGRRINFICGEDKMNIAVNARHAAEALLNALQNALLYSPRECEPTVCLYEAPRNGKRCMELRISNERAIYSDSEITLRRDINFRHQRIACGIPIIRRFVRESEGSLEISESGGGFILTLSLPLYTSADRLPLRRVELEEYPKILCIDRRFDLVRIKMEEVEAVFADSMKSYDS